MPPAVKGPQMRPFFLGVATAATDMSAKARGE